MTKRARKVHRILTVRQQLYRVEASKMADLRRRHADLEASQLDLIGALNEDQALHGLFVDTMARHLRSLSEAADGVARERDLQSRRLIRQAGQVRCAERLSATIDQQDARTDAEKELRETIEHVVGRTNARLP